jgi:hypothetical protein
MHILWCRSPSKKTLILAQNIENKGSEFFLPARSMVLKVVRGKIFKTLELACLSGRFAYALDDGKAPDEGFRLRLVGRTRQLAMAKMLRPCQVVKERGYLVDNLCFYIISGPRNEIKGKVDGP